jgi:hypothetical protein
MRTNLVLGSAFLGGVAGHPLGAYLACYWIWPESNLCGLVGAFVAGPIGFLAGGLGGWAAFRRHERDQQ